MPFNSNEYIFGVQSVLEALRAHQSIDKIFVQKDFKASEKLEEILGLARDQKIPLSRVPIFKLNKITRKNHQGLIAAIAAVPFMPLERIVPDLFEQGKNPLMVMLDGVTDVRNFGAICRSAECFGAHTVIIPSKGAAQVNRDAMKTSSGALNYLPVSRVTSLDQACKFLKESGFQIVAATEKAENDVSGLDLSGPTVILMGSEESGIRPALLRKADWLARVPLSGRVASLNVSVATGIMLYEVIRQRGQK